MNRLIPLAIAACIATSPVAAEDCGQLMSIDAYLESEWGETRTGVGMTGDPADLVALYVNPVTDTWTIVRTDARGNACMILAGSGWEFWVRRANL